MDQFLTIIRRPLSEISPSLVSTSDTNTNIVFLERALSLQDHVIEEGHVFGTRECMTYDDLIEKVFESDHTIVI